MICCVTGHRPSGFPFNYEDKYSKSYMLYIRNLYEKVRALINMGYTEFICGMAQGADLDFAVAVLCYKDHINRQISLEAAVPCPDQTRGWSDKYLNKYCYILSQCTEKTIVSAAYTRGCMQKRNEYMVDKSDIVLAVWNGRPNGGTWNTIQYAKRRGKEVDYIKLADYV